MHTLVRREEAAGVEPFDLATFVSLHHAELLRRAYLLTGSRADAEDLVQEALARGWLASRGRPVEMPRAYVHRTMVNLYLSRRRRWLAHREDPVADLPEPRSGGFGGVGGSRAAGDDEPHVVDERDRMWRLLLVLPPRQRAVLVLRYYEDLTETATAEVLGISVGTVRSQTWKALRRLEAALGPRKEGPEHE